MVIGGNNAAVDAARVARRLGATEVSLVYRRTRREMTAYEDCIDQAEREGVHLVPLAGPVAIKTADKRVTGITCVRMEPGHFDLSGRPAPQPLENSWFDLETDQVIIAIGRTTNIAGCCDETGLETDAAGFLRVNPHTQQSSVPWIFACGEATSGGGEVIDAIASGERAAVELDRFLTGESHAFWRVQPLVDTPCDPDAEPAPIARLVVDRGRIEKQKDSFDDAFSAYTDEDAVGQARRCLRCDYCKEHQR